MIPTLDHRFDLHFTNPFKNTPSLIFNTLFYSILALIFKTTKKPSQVTTLEPEFFFAEPVEMTYSAANRLATYDGQAVSFDAENQRIGVDFVVNSQPVLS
ncbi:MAG: hypothetical protein ABFS56_35035 [Pseudomonadota bacterium]